MWKNFEARLDENEQERPIPLRRAVFDVLRGSGLRPHVRVGAGELGGTVLQLVPGVPNGVGSDGVADGRVGGNDCLDVGRVFAFRQAPIDNAGAGVVALARPVHA